MEPTRENVLSTLGKIVEPDLKNDLVSLNLIEDLEISEEKITLTVQISNPALHARKRMQEAIEFNLKRVFGEQIALSCVIKGMSTENRSARRKILPDVKYIVAIASGKGGVGKSTITANLAGGLQKQGYKVGIVDADIYGPSMPTMFDLVGERPKMVDIDGKGLIQPLDANGIGILSIGFFTDQDLSLIHI
jgi:ATP-binding protein involved in chromosome partitioning